MNKDQQLTALKTENAELKERNKNQLEKLEKVCKTNEELTEEINDICKNVGYQVAKRKPKSVGVDLINICKLNGIEDITSMTISETKKITFVLKNLFQELKAHGE